MIIVRGARGGIDLRFLRIELRIGISLLLFVICKPCLIVLFGLCQFLFGSVELLLVIVQLFLPVTDLFLAVRELFFSVRELLLGVIELILRLGQLIVGFGDDLVISAACAGFQGVLQRRFHRVRILFVRVGIDLAAFGKADINLGINLAVPSVLRYIKVGCDAAVAQRGRAALKIQVERRLADADQFVCIIGEQVFRILLVVVGDADFFADIVRAEIARVTDALIRFVRQFSGFKRGGIDIGKQRMQLGNLFAGLCVSPTVFVCEQKKCVGGIAAAGLGDTVQGLHFCNILFLQTERGHQLIVIEIVLRIEGVARQNEILFADFEPAKEADAQRADRQDRNPAAEAALDFAQRGFGHRVFHKPCRLSTIRWFRPARGARFVPLRKRCRF